MQTALIGADPEYIAVNSEGMPSSVIDKIGGNKESPRPVHNGALQEDNVLAEINIDPADSEDMFVSNIRSVTSQLRSVLEEHQLSLSKYSSARYDLDEICADDRAFEFGCSPDFNAYSLEDTPIYPPDEVGLLRAAGGHIHISFDNVTPGWQKELVKWCDIYLGLPSVLVDPDRERRQFYGKGGAYRPKAYGIEYRVLSNFWVHDETFIRWAYRGARKALEQLQETGRAPNVGASSIINNYHTCQCRRTIDYLNSRCNLGIEIPESK